MPNLWLNSPITCQQTFPPLTLWFVMVDLGFSLLFGEGFSQLQKAPCIEGGFANGEEDGSPGSSCFLLLNCRCALYNPDINLLPDMKCKCFLPMHGLLTLFFPLVNFSWHTVWHSFTCTTYDWTTLCVMPSSTQYSSHRHHAAPSKYHWLYFLCCAFHPYILFIPNYCPHSPDCVSWRTEFFHFDAICTSTFSFIIFALGVICMKLHWDVQFQ